MADVTKLYTLFRNMVRLLFCLRSSLSHARTHAPTRVHPHVGRGERESLCVRVSMRGSTWLCTPRTRLYFLLILCWSVTPAVGGGVRYCSTDGHSRVDTGVCIHHPYL